MSAAHVLHQAPETTPRWVEVLSHLDPRYGGLSSAIPGLARSLNKLPQHQRVDVSLAAFCSPGEHFTPAGFTEDQLQFWPTSRKLWLRNLTNNQANTGQELHRAFQQQLQGAQGVHIHGLWEQSTAIAASTARKIGLPYIISAHGMLEPWALGSSRFKKLVYSQLVERRNVANAAVLHALTQAEARQYIHFGARAPIAVVPNAVEIPAKSNPKPFFNAYPDLQGKRILLFMGRLHRKKGLDLLLDAWACVVPYFSDAHLVLAGPDSENTQARLEKLIAQHRLARSVTFTGMLQGQEKWSALAAAEAFVLPSSSEGLSVAVLEALGMGLPVLVTRACNMPEVVTTASGWQVEATLDQLVPALKQVFQQSRSDNQEMGIRGIELIQTRHTWATVARQMAEVYRWVAGGPKPFLVDLVIPA